MVLPTIDDKIILIEFGLHETTRGIIETKRQFSTLDVGCAFIGFKADELQDKTATIHMLNLLDDAEITRIQNVNDNYDAVAGIYYYQLQQEELAHAGNWIASTQFADINGKAWGMQKFTYGVSEDIL